MEKSKIGSLIELLHGDKEIKAQGIFNSNTHHFLGRLMLFFMGIPKMNNKHGKVILTIENNGKQKIWKRYFNNSLFQTSSNQEGRLFIEKQGVFSFYFLLQGDENRVEYLFQKMKIGKIKIPKIISLNPYASSTKQNETCWDFEVGIYFLFKKALICYTGTIALVSKK